MLTNQVKNSTSLFSSPDTTDNTTATNDLTLSTGSNFHSIVEQNTIDIDKAGNTCNIDRVEIFKVAASILKEITKLFTQEPGKVNKSTKELDDIKKYSDIYLFVLSTLQNQIEDKVENLTKEIAYLDLNKAGAVDKILANADLIENLRGLEENIKQFSQNINLESTANKEELNSATIKLDTHLKEDLGIQMESFIAQLKEASQKPEQPALDESPAPGIKLLENQIDTKFHEVTDRKIAETSREDSSSEDFSIKYKTDFSINDKEESNQGNANHEKKEKQDFHLEIKSVDLFTDPNQSDVAFTYSNNAIIDSNPIQFTTKVETVNINELSSYLETQITEAPHNSQQEIKLQLNPENYGKVDLTIVKNENNEISVKLVFHNRESLELIKQDLKDSILELREVLKSKNLDLSKFEVGESSSSNTAYSGDSRSNSFNEAREEQHKRLYDTLPEWVKDIESIKQASFGSILEGI